MDIRFNLQKYLNVIYLEHSTSSGSIFGHANISGFIRTPANAAHVGFASEIKFIFMKLLEEK